MNCNTTHYRANSSSVPGDPTHTPPVQLATQPGSNTPATQPNQEPALGLVEGTWNALLKYNGYEQRKLYEKISGTSRDVAARSSSKSWGGWVGVALAWIGIAAAIGWLVHFFATRNSQRKHTAATGASRSRAAVAFYNDLLHALSRRGYARRAGQTPREFAEAVVRRGGEAFAPVMDVTNIFEAVRYGGGELEQDEFNRLQDALDKIREMTF